MQVKKQKILFRADSSFDIGVGHIMRDLVLAKEFEHAQIFFATRNLLGNINYKIEEQKYNVELLESNDIKEVIELINRYDIDMIVIDSYDIDYYYEKELKERVNIEIFVIDDTYERHHCDILLNHNIFADKSKYQTLVPSYCELRCGVEYTLLRDEFLYINIKKRDISDIDRLKVFVAMGGADSKAMNLKILEQIKDLDVEIEVVTTSANVNLQQLQNYVKDLGKINVNIDSNSLVKIIESCDIALVTPSVIVNEIIFCKIPFIAIKVAENQDEMYSFLKEKGFYVLISKNLYQLKNYIADISKTYNYKKQVCIIEKIIEKRLLE